MGLRRGVPGPTTVGSIMKTSVQELAKDLTKEYPRSPREMLAGYVVAARMLDKCRATLAGTNGEYHFDCPLDNEFLGFTGIKAEDFKAFVATGATDDAVAAWITQHAVARTRAEVIQWNNDLRTKRIADLAAARQEFLEDYIPKYVPQHRPVYVWFDVYDLEEKRL
jgi:hypothetical protein